MFTGLIETTGTVLALKTTPAGVKRLIVAAPSLAGRWRIGDSIAVNGVCLTAVDMEDVYEHHPGRFAADLAEETLQRTTLSTLSPGATLNLELPTPAGSPLGGHVVQGHVDAVARIASFIPLHADLDHTDWRLSLKLPKELMAYVIPQGSVTVDGISLTIASVREDEIEIAVIPHTYSATNLHTLLTGALVNIETDVLSKYTLRHQAHGTLAPNLETAASYVAPYIAPTPQPATAAPSTDWLTAEYLIARGY